MNFRSAVTRPNVFADKLKGAGIVSSQAGADFQIQYLSLLLLTGVTEICFQVSCSPTGLMQMSAEETNII